MFAASSAFQKKIALKPDEKKGFDFSTTDKKPVNKSWSKMLARVFKIDVLKCDCGGDLTPLLHNFAQSLAENTRVIRIDVGILHRAAPPD